MRILIFIALASVMFSCSFGKPEKKSLAYKGMYSEKPKTILLMAPINKSTNVEAKEYFHSTLLVPLAEKGFYVVPPFVSMEILKKESGYDAENFINSPLVKFGEIFGADAALFTIIHRWDKGLSSVKVEVEYILKSVKTNETLYTRRGLIDYNTAVSNNSGGLGGAIMALAATAINTMSTKYVDVAKVCNNYTFQDIPVGSYAPQNAAEGDEPAGSKSFKVRLDSKWR